MKILCHWYPSPNNIGLETLAQKLRASHITYTYIDHKDQKLNTSIDSTGLYLDGNVDKNSFDLEGKLPLDGRIVEEMNKSMFAEMELIYRWRSTLETGDSYAKIRQMYFDFLIYWNDYIIRNNIDLFIISDIPHSASEYMIYSLCRAYNIPTVICQMLPVVSGERPNMYFTVDLESIYAGFDERYKYNLNYYAGSGIEEIGLDESLKIYLENYSLDNKNVGTVVASESSESLFFLGMRRAAIYLSQKRYRTLMNKIYKFLRIKSDQKKLLKYVERLEKDPVIGENYIYFPLHLQPEASTLPNAQIYSRQELAIHMISSCLPENIKLYVKEHPAYWMSTGRHDYVSDSRSKRYYDAINGLHNVRIIKHNIPSTKLIDDSVAIATINGSAGWEAILREKPVIMFGNSFYKNIEEVYKIKTQEECYQAIDEIVNQGKGKVSKKTVAVYLKTIGETSVIGSNDYDFIRRVGCTNLSKEDNDLNMANGIYQFIERAYPSLCVDK